MQATYLSDEEVNMFELSIIQQIRKGRKGGNESFMVRAIKDSWCRACLTLGNFVRSPRPSELAHPIKTALLQDEYRDI